jgi:hypothetical protein
MATHIAKTFKEKFSQHMLPFNYTVGTPNGANLIINTMQLQVKKYISTPMSNNLPPTWAAVFFELTNMFNSVTRHLFFQVIAKSFPEILPVMALFYNQASTVHHKWADRTWRALLMEESVSQGCPLSPTFASLVVAELLEPVDHLLKQRATEQLFSSNHGNDSNRGVTQLLGYVNDVSACTPPDDLQFLCKQFNQLGSQLGCFVNPMKTRILTSTSGTSPPAAICLTNPALATRIKHTISKYSTKPNNTTPTWHPFLIKLTNGCCLL